LFFQDDSNFPPLLLSLAPDPPSAPDLYTISTFWFSPLCPPSFLFRSAFLTPFPPFRHPYMSLITVTIIRLRGVCLFGLIFFLSLPFFVERPQQPTCWQVTVHSRLKTLQDPVVIVSGDHFMPATLSLLYLITLVPTFKNYFPR